MGQVGPLDDEREARPSVRRHDRAIFQTFSDVVRQNGEWIDAHSGELVGIVETYRTAKVTIPEMNDRVLEIPVPGETTLVPASVILQFMQDFGLSRRLPK